MRRMRLHLVWGLVLGIVICGAGLLQSVRAGEKPKYVFLMIGDGMGAGERAVAEKFRELTTVKAPTENEKKLVMNQFPVKGMTTTKPFGGGVTDSAAAGTALACGEKTKNGVISMDPQKEKKLKAISYDAKESGRKVAIISSVPIDHATPAAFFACQKSRNDYYEIACQLGGTGFNFFAGQPYKGTGKAKGRKKPAEFAQEAGYTVYADKAGASMLKAGDDKVYWMSQFPFVLDAKQGDIELAQVVAKAIELCDNDKGFFMMVEGGKIDWAGHGNDLAGNVRETLAFDAAVGVAYEFYKKHPKETLIVVTADHETGGLKTDFTTAFNPEVFVKTLAGVKMTGGSLTGKAKAWKKQKLTAEKVMAKLEQEYGLTDLSDAEKAELQKVVEAEMSGEKGSKELKHLYGKKDMIANACLKMVAKRCGATWSTSGHTGADVPTTAIGVGSEKFAGHTDNTDIANNIRALLK